MDKKVRIYVQGWMCGSKQDGWSIHQSKSARNRYIDANKKRYAEYSRTDVRPVGPLHECTVTDKDMEEEIFFHLLSSDGYKIEENNPRWLSLYTNDF